MDCMIFNVLYMVFRMRVRIHTGDGHTDSESAQPFWTRKNSKLFLAFLTRKNYKCFLVLLTGFEPSTFGTNH